MKRREFITLLGGGSMVAWPLAARAQQPAMPVIGYFSGRSPDAEAPLRVPFLKALVDSGFTIGRDVAIEYRFSEGHDQRLPALAAELVRRQVTMLVATDGPSAVVAKAATATIPIVFTSAFDPVQTGLVASFNRPGGNATGIHVFGTALGGKRLDLLRQLVPNARLVAFIVSPNNPSTHALDAVASAKVDAVNVLASPILNAAHRLIIERMHNARLPTIYQFPESAEDGGLLAYGPRVLESYRRIVYFVDRILKGAKPADLPIEQPTKFELVVNLKTASALSLTIPPALLARADEVIE
jgi:putative ABC transport system substrate-binding protein